MSAPRTNLEKQERRHKPLLTALRGVIIFAVLCILFIIAYSVISSDEETETEVITEPTTPSTTPSTGEEGDDASRLVPVD